MAGDLELTNLNKDLWGFEIQTNSVDKHLNKLAGHLICNVSAVSCIPVFVSVFV